MTTFVLVHGSFHGGWAWRDVAAGLRDVGHDVFTPTLTGLGERAHLISERPTLQLHAEDVANVLFYEDLRDVVLVGHSYAGLVITLAAERSDRIGQLVYLDAMVPQHGVSLLGMVPPEYHGALTAPSDGPVHTYAPMVEALSGAVPAWALERLTAQPATDLDEPILLPTRAAERLPRTFIAASAADVTHLAPGVRELPWRYMEYEGDHEALLNAPNVVTAALLEAIA